MTISEFKRVGRLLKGVYSELEQEAIKEGINILSPEYDMFVDKARLAVLEKNGFTLDEYRAAKEQVEGISKEGTLAIMQETQKQLKDISEIHIHTKEEITDIAKEVAKEFIKPPQIINQIVKETTIEKPQIIREVLTEKVIQQVAYNEKPLQEKLNAVSKRLDEIKIPDPVNVPKMLEDMKGYMSKALEYNINTLNMPNFRKLAMGLQQQIDELSSNGVGSGTLSLLTTTSTVDGSNLDFTFTSAPSIIVVDQGRMMQKVSSDGTVNWTGTTSVTLTIAPTFDIYGL